MNEIWNDPMVKEALSDGRQPWDIALLPCPVCGKLSYYNEGSHFSCRFCDKSFYVVSDEAPGPIEVRNKVYIENLVRLDDAVDDAEVGP